VTEMSPEIFNISELADKHDSDSNHNCGQNRIIFLRNVLISEMFQFQSRLLSTRNH